MILGNLQRSHWGECWWRGQHLLLDHQGNSKSFWSFLWQGHICHYRLGLEIKTVFFSKILDSSFKDNLISIVFCPHPHQSCRYQFRFLLWSTLMPSSQSCLMSHPSSIMIQICRYLYLHTAPWHLAIMQYCCLLLLAEHLLIKTTSLIDIYQFFTCFFTFSHPHNTLKHIL